MGQIEGLYRYYLSSKHICRRFLLYPFILHYDDEQRHKLISQGTAGMVRQEKDISPIVALY